MQLTPLLEPKDLEAAGIAKLNTLAKWRITGEGPRFIRSGRAIKYHPEDVAEWLDARKVKSTSEAA